MSLINNPSAHAYTTTNACTYEYNTENITAYCNRVSCFVNHQAVLHSEELREREREGEGEGEGERETRGGREEMVCRTESYFRLQGGKNSKEI